MNGSPQYQQQRRWERVSGSPVQGATRVDSKAFRRRIGRSEILDTSRWLTQRDRDICSNVYEYKVLTATQIQHLHFNHPRVASRRLLKLYESQVLDRFQPRAVSGSAPNHYILGELGVHIIAGERSLDVKKLRERQRADLKLAYSPRLTHLIEINDFFSWLTFACRHSNERYRLTRWWSERRCAIECHDAVRPDGLGRIEESGRSCTFFFELDRGTERGDRLVDKVRSYEWFVHVKKGVAQSLLFLFPTEDRERRAREKLDPIPGLVIATTYRDKFYGEPLGPSWLPLDDQARLSLLDLSPSGWST